MIQELAWRAADWCLPEGNETEKEIVAYGLECRISDGLQIAALALSGWVLRCAAETACFSLCFTALKRQVGGYHCATHLSCIGTFTLAAVAVSRLAGLVPSPLVLPGVLATFTLVIRLAPVAHPNHPKSKAAQQKSRRTGIGIAAAYAALLPLAAGWFPKLAVAGAVGGLAAALTLVIPVKNERLDAR